MFNDSQSFYYCEQYDLTNTVQRNVQKDDEGKKLPIWKTVLNVAFKTSANWKLYQSMYQSNFSIHNTMQ